jgi:hypothetical protein
LEDGGQTLRPQDDPALYAAGSYHFQRILGMQTQASIRYTRVLCVIWLVLALLVYIGLCAFLYGSQAADWGSLPTILLVVSAFFGLFGSLGLALGVFHRFFLPAMRGPRPMPLDDLLRELQSRIGPPETGGKTS